MTHTEKYLTPYGLTVDSTFEEYCSRIPGFFFKKDVPEDVLQNFEVIEQLLAHSYYAYRFIDEAYSKALLTFEMAMNIRYRELGGTKKKMTFDLLIQALSKRNQFDSAIELLKHFNWMRNYYAHPPRHSFAGIMLWHKIMELVAVINQMYDDTDLRLARKKLEKEFRESVDGTLKHNKTMVLEINGKKEALHQFDLLFVDNKENPPEYHLSYTPLFDLTTQSDSDALIPLTSEIILTNPCFTEGGMNATMRGSDKLVRFYSAESDDMITEKYIKWNTEFNCKKQKFLYSTSINRNNSILYFDSFWNFLKK